MSDATEKRTWQKQGQEKRTAVREMFAEIAETYDHANSIMTLRQHGKWRERAVAKLRLSSGDSALDICCGTGDFLLPLRHAVGSNGVLVGIDFCRPMLELARQKTDAATQLYVADACDLPLASSSFDAVTVGWGLRNVPDISKALAEVARVTKPGGRFVCLDMSRPTGFIGKIGERVCHLMLPLLGKKLGKADAYEYLPKSTLSFATKDELTSLLQAAGFSSVTTKDIMFGNVCMHVAVKA
ncbi:bifunctional demethylmenaquinone methyltransferase/2-methoxy-6-polyprenyl-1,4-benzoquinol methylase UbiE [Kamptonema cortianum]|nr:bifunctional demethylmenaquinone methyltransferase/2-methoxy-6-polyprenyl-1,4-benzoquinol methylase UbiE [Geitlerinema splendidum]MDK3156139.1 bifunctional demethylmenaquinone methyltransferase/2-methoxy-6-polyprenyl-1,4-benzoquinol methylase UbiE [Kamptonema cortianum]